jgi:hypothetical protein
MDSSRELASIYTISFVISLYLILLIGIQTFNMMELKFNPNQTAPKIFNWAQLW